MPQLALPCQQALANKEIGVIVFSRPLSVVVGLNPIASGQESRPTAYFADSELGKRPIYIIILGYDVVKRAVGVFGRFRRPSVTVMRTHKVQNLRSLRDEMKSVARGARPAPADACKPSFNAVDVLVRLLTPENRALLAVIRDRKPRSVAELAGMSGRAQPNLTRTLAKLEAAGLVAMTAAGGRRKAPCVTVKKIVVEIDPYSNRDRIEFA